MGAKSFMWQGVQYGELSLVWNLVSVMGSLHSLQQKWSGCHVCPKAVSTWKMPLVLRKKKLKKKQNNLKINKN